MHHDLEAWLDADLADLHPACHAWLDARALAAQRRAWLAERLAGCTDLDRAARFETACPVAGASVDDYLAREHTLPDGHAVIDGIRFRGGDLGAPFVDVDACTRPLDGPDLAALVPRLLTERTTFAPRVVRVLRGAHRPLDGLRGLEVAVDQHVVAGRLGDLAIRLPRPDALALSPASVLQARALIDLGYANLRRRDPALAALVHPADDGELTSCAEDDALWAIHLDGQAIGVLAARRQEAFGLRGWCMIDEILLPGARGRGLAAPAQARLIASLCARDPGRVLFGTIAGANAPSLATARRVGRRVVASYLWLGADLSGWT